VLLLLLLLLLLGCQLRRNRLLRQPIFRAATAPAVKPLLRRP
jgi:hypothetical protein